jgi:MFS family permease
MLASQVDAAMNLWSIARALAHRNFRLFFFGQTISLIGTWMQQLAMTWFVYDLTHSPFLLGVVGFSGQIPTFFLAPVAGVLTDRWNRHRTLLATQSLAMLQAFLLYGLTVAALDDQAKVGAVIGLSILLGLVNAFDMPTRQAFLIDMIERQDLPNAIALNSSMVNAARLVGPSVAGLLIAAVGTGMCFLLNGLSYLAVLAALLAMRVAPRPRGVRHPPLLRGLREGFVYAFGFRPIRAILLLLGLISFTGVPLALLLPVFARDVLQGGPDTYGFLAAASGLGALTGGLYLASRQTVLGLGRVMALTAGLFGLGMIGFSFAAVLWLSWLLLLPTGFCMMVQMAASNTVLQTLVDEDKRGRVMSFYTMAFMGMAPLGSLLAGALADRIGAPWTVRLGGLACVGGAVLFALRLPALRALARPVSQRAGILPEVATGVQATAELTLPPED